MKKILLIVLLVSSSLVYSQIDVGVKAGLNYSANDNLNISGGFVGINENFSSDAKLGFTAGVYGTAYFGKIYIQPELLYSKTTSSYGENPDFTLSYLEVPVLAGYNILNNFSFYIGPSAQFILDNKFSSAFDLDFDTTTMVNINLGLNFKLSKFGVDLRYLKGLTNTIGEYDDGIVVDGFLYRLNTKPSQLVLSLSYQLN